MNCTRSMCRLIYSKEIRAQQHKPTNWFSKLQHAMDGAQERPHGDTMEKGHGAGAGQGSSSSSSPHLCPSKHHCSASHSPASISPPWMPSQKNRAQHLCSLSNLKDLILWNRGHKGLAGLHAIMLSAPLKGGFHGSKTPLLGNSEIFSEVKLVRNIYQSINSAQLALVRSVWEHRYLLQRINSGENKNWRPRVWGAVSPLF